MTANTFKFTNTERDFISSSTNITKLACSSWVYCYGILSTFSRFVFDHSNKPTPRTVPDRFSKIAVLHHVFDSQIFVGYQVIRLYKLPANFVKKVVPLISNLSINFSNSNFGFLSSFSAFLLFAKYLLSSCKFSFGFSKIFRIRNFSSIRERGK